MAAFRKLVYENGVHRRNVLYKLILCYVYVLLVMNTLCIRPPPKKKKYIYIYIYITNLKRIDKKMNKNK